MMKGWKTNWEIQHRNVEVNRNIGSNGNIETLGLMATSKNWVKLQHRNIGSKMVLNFNCGVRFSRFKTWK